MTGEVTMSLEETRNCPGCKYVSEEAFRDCPMCGLIIQKHHARQAKLSDARKQSDMEYEKYCKEQERKKLELNEPARCPKCMSNQIHYEKKGYGIGKGLIGLATLGPLGLAAGAIGKNDLLSICVKCGNKW
jgi:hypothetical protein